MRGRVCPRVISRSYLNKHTNSTHTYHTSLAFVPLHRVCVFFYTHNIFCGLAQSQRAPVFCLVSTETNAPRPGQLFPGWPPGSSCDDETAWGGWRAGRGRGGDSLLRAAHSGTAECTQTHHGFNDGKGNKVSKHEKQSAINVSHRYNIALFCGRWLWIFINLIT